MTCWMAMLVAFTGLFLRDGAPAGTSKALVLGVLGLFWVAGIGVSAVVAGKPLVTVEVRSRGRVYVRKRYPWRVVERQFGARDKIRAELVEATDSEGDPYFHARLVAVGELELDIWEGHDRSRAAAEVARFNAAL
jgi:hypothetical protein